MKKSLLLAVSLLFSLTTIFAQRVTVPEPEFADQTYLLTSDNTYKLLPRETGVIKTKAGASLYLTGIGKVKTRLTLPGKSSKISIPSGQVRFIIKAANNDTDPSSFINIFPFEIKGKERRAQLAEAGTFSASKSNSLGQIDFKAKKYGESSYYIVIDNLQPGEYGINLGDPDKLNEKNILLSAKHRNPHSNSLRHNSSDDSMLVTSPLIHFLLPRVAIQPLLQA